MQWTPDHTGSISTSRALGKLDHASNTGTQVATQEQILAGPGARLRPEGGGKIIIDLIGKSGPAWKWAGKKIGEGFNWAKNKLFGKSRSAEQATGPSNSPPKAQPRSGASADPNLPQLSANAPKPLGRGSTGRTTPANLSEQVAMTAAREHPAGQRLIRVKLTDPRWPEKDGWVKMQQIENNVVVHYVRNTRTGAVDDFKFK